WDQQQTHESLVRYLVEESYETIEAIESGDRDHLREELGDLLLQVMFHARVASQHPDEPFDLDDVAATIVDKLIRRHPHVFAGLEVAGVDDVEANWETIKATENSRTSAMEGIPPGLPALSLAAKVVSRSAAVGLPSSVRPAETAHTEETLGETAHTEETLGDVLFALVAAAHAAGIDAEQALRSRARREMADVRAREDRVDRVAEVATE
ncbi:MAG: MazG family protein, partial [Nocardioidaceae bacterium]